MHEVSIASNVIDAIRDYCQRRGLDTVKAVGVRIGVLSDVVPDALEFGFDILTRETEYEQTALQIELVAARGRCRQCGREFDVHELLFMCDRCQSTDVELLHGQELEIAYFEIEDEQPGAQG